ncbi:MAG: ribosomal protein methylthiotransferase accessory factor [Acidimicrobiaceae bacterium]|nr:ribosomal protein methylthiotransferase accessory factor [Acidimicrobiaceae bacterium]
MAETTLAGTGAATKARGREHDAGTGAASRAWGREHDAGLIASSPGGSFAIAVPPSIQAWLEGGIVTASVGFDLLFEGGQLAAADRDARQLLSIRLSSHEALIGPRWVPGRRGPCAGCAEHRIRQAVDHPLIARVDVNASPRSGWPAALEVLLEVGLEHLGDHALEPGEMLRVGLTQTRRHRVVRSMACPLCGPRTHSRPLSRGCLPARPPEPRAWQSRRSGDAVPLRGRPSPIISEHRLSRLVDHHVGPVLQVMRDNRAPFAMSGALIPDARDMGFGRGGDFARAGEVAILEAYERLGAFPHHGQVVQDLSYDQVCDRAVDPATLGRYSQAQLDHPNSRVRPYRPDVVMDWSYAHRLRDGEPRLVPADVAFYGYEYQHRLDYHGARHERRPDRRAHFFAESSSGCALGSTVEEAALHGLIELIERDSFLMAWCRRMPLPEITHPSIIDATSRMLLDGIEARGFDVHVLASTYDLGLPAIWALAVNRDPHAVPATYSAAGSSPVPGEAVRAALWELAQLVARPVDWDVDAVGRLVDDPSLVDTIEDHVHLSAMPERRDRVTEVLGGPGTTMGDAFPGWPRQLSRSAQGDVRGSLDHLAALCAAAGLDEVLVVDQSTMDHRDLGLRVARVIVPGILPMCFGAPQQRLGGLPRLERALAALRRGANGADPDPMFDPHPFP